MSSSMAITGYSGVQHYYGLFKSECTDYEYKIYVFGALNYYWYLSYTILK